MEILKMNDIKDNLLRYYNHGGGNIHYVGFNGLARHYNIKEGGVTDWTGYPGSGKTELLLDILKNTADWYNHKYLIHMPDAGSKEEVIGKLIHKMTGKQFEKFYYDNKGQKKEIYNRVTELEITRILPDILEYFKILVPETKNNSKALTPKEYWDYAAKNKKKLNLFGAVIDSWNYMKHDIGGQRQDMWLEDVLSYRNELAENEGLHLHTIIHPKTEQKDKNGKKIMPDMHSLKGGSEWANNGKTIIVCHREFGSKTTDIKINKAKPRIVGVEGMACLQYDHAKGAFFENVGGNKYYAHKEPIAIAKFEEDKKEQQLEDDLPF